MMRMLVTITNTLEKMPEERYIMMKVEYTNDTPATFETPNFCDASASQVAAHFEDAPLVMYDKSAICNQLWIATFILQRESNFTLRLQKLVLIVLATGMKGSVQVARVWPRAGIGIQSLGAPSRKKSSAVFHQCRNGK
jgi:hypothetical protein